MEEQMAPFWNYRSDDDNDNDGFGMAFTQIIQIGAGQCHKLRYSSISDLPVVSASDGSIKSSI